MGRLSRLCFCLRWPLVSACRARSTRFIGLDDPSAIANRALADKFDATVAVREIEAALDANDADLAQSFVDLADDRMWR